MNNVALNERQGALWTRLAAFLVYSAVMIGYYVLLSLNYRYIISPRFEYLSFYARYTPTTYWFVDFLYVIAPLPFMPRGVSRPSDVAMAFVYLIGYVPIVLMLTALPGVPSLDLQSLKFVTMLGLILMSGCRLLVRGETAIPLAITKGAYSFGLVTLGSFIVLVLGVKYGFELKLHAVTEVYEQRGEYHAIGSGMRILLYLGGILQMVIIPLLAAAGLVLRKYYLLIVAFSFSVFMFSISGSKSAFISVMYMLVTYGTLYFFRRSFLSATAIGCALIVLLGGLLSEVATFDLINDLFVRRILVMQGMLYYFYYEGFQAVEPLLLRHSVLSFMGPAPITSPEEYVGAICSGGYMHANANLFADGYVNAKYLGVLLASAACGIYLGVVDRVSRRLDLLFSVTSLAMIYQMITQTGLIKLMGIHGGLVICVFLMIAPFEASNRESNGEA